MTPYDELNILSCMTAKKLGCRYAAARIHSREFDEDEDYIMGEYGIDMLLNPEKEAAREIIWHIVLLGSLEAEAFFDNKVIIAELEMDEDNPLANMTIQQVKEYFNTDMPVVAIIRNKEIIIPGGAVYVRNGDKLEIILSLNSVKDIFKKLHIKKRLWL